MTRQVSETVLKYTVDRASIAQARASTQSARQIVDDYARTLKDLNPAARASLTAVADYFDQTSDRASELARELTQQIDLMRRLEGAADSAMDAPSGGGGGGTSGGGRFRGAAETADRFGSIGSQIFSGLGGGELANAAGLIGDLGGSISSLGAAGAIAAPAMIAVTAAFDSFNRTLEPAKQRSQIALDANEQYYQALATLSTRGAQIRLQELEFEELVLEARARNAQQAYAAALQEAFSDNPLTAAAAIFAAATGEFDALRQSASEAFTALQANRDLQVQLTNGLKNNEFALVDSREATLAAAEAERTLAQERLSQLDQDIQRAIENRRLIREGTTEGIDNILTGLREQISVYENALALLETQISAGGSGPFATAEALAAAQERAQGFRDQLQGLNQQVEDLTGVVRPLVETREQEADAVARTRERLENLKDARKREADEAKRNSEKAAQEVARAEQQIADIRERTAERVADIQRDLAERETGLARDNAEKIGDARRDFARDEREALIQAARERAKIIRDSERGIQTAVGNRDAVALLEAQRQREDGLRDQEETFQDERRKRQESLQQQTQDAQRAYARQLEDARRAASSQIALAQQRANAEVATQRAAIQAALGLQQQRVNLEVNAYNVLGSAVTSFVGKMAQSAAFLQGAAATAGKQQAVVKPQQTVNVNMQGMTTSQFVNNLSKALQRGAVR